MTSTNTTPSSSSSFFKKLNQRIKTVNSHLCIGLDPHRSEILPLTTTTTTSSSSNQNISLPDAAYTFCHTLILSTLPHAAAYKPNLAFFEALGVDGIKTLERVLSLIPEEVPILLDAKRGDIGSTATAYAQACFELGGREVEAVTVNPLMGWDAIEPFVTGTYSDKTAFILCKTSNPTSSQILSLPTSTTPSQNTPLYQHIATLTRHNSSSQSLGLVVGATDPTALSNVRNIVGNDVWILAKIIFGSIHKIRSAQIWLVSIEKRTSIALFLQRGIIFDRWGISGARYGLRRGDNVRCSMRVSQPRFIQRRDAENSLTFDVIFGPAYKGISLGALVCASLYTHHGVDVGFAYNRKEVESSLSD